MLLSMDGMIQARKCFFVPIGYCSGWINSKVQRQIYCTPEDGRPDGPDPDGGIRSNLSVLENWGQSGNLE